MQARIYIAQTAQTIHPATDFLMSHVWCCIRAVEMRMPSTLMVTREILKGIVQLAVGNRSEDLSLDHSLTEKNNVILDYYGV